MRLKLSLRQTRPNQSIEIELTVSMISDKAVEHFIIGMFENQKVRLFDRENEAEFVIKTVEMIPDPVFSGKINFKKISPIVLTKRTIYKGKESAYYMSPVWGLGAFNKIRITN